MGRFSKLETKSADAAGAAEAGSSDEIASGFGPGLRRPRRPETASSGLPPMPAVEYDALHYKSSADRLFYGGQYKQALRLYARAVQDDPSAIEPWIGQVRCLIEMRQHKEAMVWAKRALELFPDNRRIASLQGWAYALQGMVSRGIQCSDYAMSRPGGSIADPLVWVVRGCILSLGDTPSNADACFERALTEKHQDDWQTPMSIGLFFLGQKQWSSASEYLEKALDLETTNEYLWERLGYARERLGLGSAAIEAYQAALHLNARCKGALDGLARVGQSSVFRRIFRRLSNLFPHRGK